MAELRNPQVLNPHKGRTGLDRIRAACGYSVDGMRSAYRSESAFRQEIWAAAIMLPAAFWLGRGWVEVGLLAGSVVMVLIVELLNSAVEATVDRVSLELHDLSKRAKDFASAAVMLAPVLTGGISARRPLDALLDERRREAVPASSSTAARANGAAPGLHGGTRVRSAARSAVTAGSSSTAAARSGA